MAGQTQSNVHRVKLNPDRWDRIKFVKLNNVTQWVIQRQKKPYKSLQGLPWQSNEEVTSAWEVVQQIPVDLRHTDIKASLKIAIKFNIYAYDAYFLKCAENFRSQLLTLDLVMKRVARCRS